MICGCFGWLCGKLCGFVLWIKTTPCCHISTVLGMLQLDEQAQGYWSELRIVIFWLDNGWANGKLITWECVDKLLKCVSPQVLEDYFTLYLSVLKFAPKVWDYFTSLPALVMTCYRQADNQNFQFWSLLLKGTYGFQWHPTQTLS